MLSDMHRRSNKKGPGITPGIRCHLGQQLRILTEAPAPALPGWSCCAQPDLIAVSDLLAGEACITCTRCGKTRNYTPDWHPYSPLSKETR